ncbi:MAG TPA: hypothetical protein VFU02_23535 [Polyangiaceae bacterium]|nr:hypothetical protein [Polyangiaceae bacterium]
MANEPKENPETPPNSASTNDPNQDDQHGSAARDLADGLDLMLRAARKAARHVDPQKIEALGRRALDNLDALKRRRVEDLRQEAKRKLDPRRIEEIAEDAGKELWKVVERVTDRVDALVNRGVHSDSNPASGQAEARKADGGEATPGDDADPAKRVRVSDD